MRIFLLSLFIFFFLPPLFAQEPGKKSDWLPEGNLFPTLRFDFKESQISGGLYGFYAGYKWEDRALACFSAGFRRNVIRWQHIKDQASELGFELSVFPQFFFEDPFKNFQVNFFNIEFKVGLHYQFQINDHWRLRLRIYHISDHLGDDFIFRTQIDTFYINRRIYEVVDLSAAWIKEPFMVYAVTGAVVHSAYERLPFVFQMGFQWKKPSKKLNWFQWIAGIDIKSEQETCYRPCIHTGAGVVLGKPDRHPFTILADYYNGYLPYSLYDHILIQWIGASIYFDLF